MRNLIHLIAKKMPHLLIERLRQVPKALVCNVPSRKDFPLGVYFVELLDIIAAIIFLVGSVCFLPEYSKELNTFLLGCLLFVVGSILYCILCSLALLEACIAKGLGTLEAGENVLYLIGSWCFLVGTILYWPDESDYPEIEADKNISPGLVLAQYCVDFTEFHRRFYGTVLFIFGSIVFAFAAFLNALNQRTFSKWSARMLSATTSLYLGGSLSYLMGSIAFLPGLGCGEQMLTLGAWCFIVGSSLFLVGSVISVWRIHCVLASPEAEEFTPRPTGCSPAGLAETK